MSTYIWTESPAWQLSFFGLPSRIPWPVGAPLPDGEHAQFDMAALLSGIEAMVKNEPNIVGPWNGFLAAAPLFDGMTEALEDQEYARADELLREIETHHAGSPYSLFHQAFVHRQAGNDEEAVRLYAEAAQKAPAIPFIWDNLGTMLAENGNREQAIQAFLNALRSNPQDQVALESLVQLKAAVKLLRDQNDPKSVVIVPVDQFRGMMLQQIEHLAAQPDQLLQLGEVHLREGIIPDVGLKALEKAHEVRPEHQRTLIALGAAYRMAGDLEKSKEKLTRYTTEKPEDSWGFFNLAQTLNALKDTDGEMAALDQALKADPNLQPALGIRFQLNEPDPAKETQLAEFADANNAWMPLLLASSIARDRGEFAIAAQYAARAYERNPNAEEVLLHYCAMLGDAGDGATLELVIRPAVTGGRFSKRLDWNFAQSLRQLGQTEKAVEILRTAQLGEAPEDFKKAAESAIEFWNGQRAQAEGALETHQAGTLLRPVLLTLEDGDGGILLAPRQPLPAEHTFSWRANGPEARVRLQQGQSGGAQPPKALGVFTASEIQPVADGATNIECRVEVAPDGRLFFNATQGGRKLPVAWSAA
jgi:tetratricopeptide (TPR) repeat protein